jgi:hypothetical protein
VLDPEEDCVAAKGAEAVGFRVDLVFQGYGNGTVGAQPREGVVFVAFVEFGYQVAGEGVGEGKRFLGLVGRVAGADCGLGVLRGFEMGGYRLLWGFPGLVFSVGFGFDSQ